MSLIPAVRKQRQADLQRCKKTVGAVTQRNGVLKNRSEKERRDRREEGEKRESCSELTPQSKPFNITVCCTA